ncbi:hypothetical protein HED49_21125 [Ochrobactrum daejeonense]|nr:hypothetical protein [Brucella daejeonensis]
MGNIDICSQAEFATALSARDYVVASKIGMTLLRNTKLSILQAINVMRAAGMAGDLPAFSEAFRAAADLVSKTRNDDAQFSRAWKQVLRFEIETSDVSMAVNTVERARSLGVSSEEDELFWHRCSHFWVSTG